MMKIFSLLNNTLDARRSTLDARRSTLDARRSTLDARHSTLDTRHSTNNVNLSKKSISYKYHNNSKKIYFPLYSFQSILALQIILKLYLYNSIKKQSLVIKKYQNFIITYFLNFFRMLFYYDKNILKNVLYKNYHLHKEF